MAVNPYRWDLVDPTLFYGRGETVNYLLDRLLAGDRFAVAGGRRMGKTTLLRRLEADLTALGADGGLLVVPVFVDMAELYAGPAEQAYAVLGRRASAAARAAGLQADHGEAGSGPELVDSLRALLDVTRRLGRLQLVFLFDEIERVLRAEWGGGFLAYWRMILNNMGELSRCVSAVFSGADGIYQIAQDAGSPLGNILAWQELELLSREETARLVHEPTGVAWPEALVARVFELSGGQPCLIQYLMQRVCDGDVEAWDESVAGAEVRFLREHATMFVNWWQGFDDAARAIYGELADGGALPEGELIARYPGQGKRALDVLAHTGVVRWDRAERTVRAAGTLFERWARESALSQPPPVYHGAPFSPRPPGPLPLARERGRQNPVFPGAGNVEGESPAIGVGRRIGTVLFTDIVSSTRMTAQLGDRPWLELLAAHNTCVREALVMFRGQEVKTTGDGFLALFDTPAAAIKCAVSIAGAVRPLGLEVRAGLHAGEYEAIGGDVFGIAISYAAWVMSLARGGEVIVSETVRSLVAGSGIRFVNRGRHQVKGTRERHRLYAVDHSSDLMLPSPS